MGNSENIHLDQIAPVVASSAEATPDRGDGEGSPVGQEPSTSTYPSRRDGAGASPSPAPSPTSSSSDSGESPFPRNPESEASSVEAFGIQAPDADESDPDVDHLDPLGVVRPGDSSSLGTLVARSLGYSSTYSDEVVEKVRSLQEEYGLEPDGIVRGLTWTLVLPIGWTPESAGAEWFVFEDLGGTVDMLPDGRMDRTLWKKLWLDRFAERL